MNEHVVQAIMLEQKHTYIVTDRDLCITEVSTQMPECCAIVDTGDPAAYLGDNLLDWFPELFGYEDSLQAILAGNMPKLHLEWVNRETAAGDMGYLNITDLPLRDDAGDIVGLVHLIEDVTEWGKAMQRSVQRGNESALLRAKLSESNAQLQQSYRREQEHNRRLALLHEISTAINSTLDLPTILTAACQKLVENFAADHSGVLLFDETYTYGEVAAEYPAQNAVGIRIPLAGYTATLIMIETAQPCAIYDAQHDPLMEKVWGVMRSLGIKSILIVPLVIKNRVIGSFSLDIAAAPRHFEAAESELCQTIAAQLAIAIDNARWLERERARMEQELETARQIQVSLLPYIAPEMAGLDIVHTSIPARQVGGDFYSYFIFAEGVLGIAVGDVSGKGMQAALMMALSVGLITTEIHREIAPAALLAALNAELYPHTQRNRMNSALVYVILERLGERWAMYAANAGLISPLIRHAAGAVEWLEVEGVPLGAMKNVKYVELRQELVPGDIVILSSDGIVEATNPAGEMYSFARLMKCVATAPRGGASEIQDWILADVRAFVGDAEQHDDLTLIVILIE